MSLSQFLSGAALFVLATLVVALARLLSSRRAVDWVLAEQLLGTAGIAALLLLGVGTDSPGVIDLALLIALLASIATIAFARPLRRRGSGRGV
ncbi:multiple resistance and pH regulation protein F [Thiohalocapsa marina]|uniref:Multiple resistance and pH regulation protein F n=1 Tax=Thiohalocapsa marina TaxID=424902 RepID=A0A5M8FT14_9GAMM|nr:monovalent cation/H+ antiporter complex subunit F [Thiohalocapsa marina]KAA6186692.1 multiple resistance and pH regulation protein F [Thiohalocapsa marina]